MRDYQAVTNNPYLLPHHLYMRTLYIIRDYDRLKEKAEKLLDFKTSVKEKFVKKLASIYNFTKDKYLELLNLYEAHRNNLINRLEEAIKENSDYWEK